MGLRGKASREELYTSIGDKGVNMPVIIVKNL